MGYSQTADCFWYSFFSTCVKQFSLLSFNLSAMQQKHFLGLLWWVMPFADHTIRMYIWIYTVHCTYHSRYCTAQGDEWHSPDSLLTKADNCTHCSFWWLQTELDSTQSYDWPLCMEMGKANLRVQYNVLTLKYDFLISFWSALGDTPRIL